MTNADTAQQLDDLELFEALKSAEEWLLYIGRKPKRGTLPANSQSLQWAEEQYAALVAEVMHRKSAMR